MKNLRDMLSLTMRKAFTLVELLIVIAIMGILTVIAVSQFRTAKRKPMMWLVKVI